jgi:hypothetical protein
VPKVNVVFVHLEILIKMLRLHGCNLFRKNGVQHVNMSVCVFGMKLRGTDEAYSRHGEMKID